MRPQFHAVLQGLFSLLIAITAGENLSLAQPAYMTVSGQPNACDNFSPFPSGCNTPNPVVLGPSTTPPLLLPTVSAFRGAASAATEGMVQFGSISGRVQASSSQLPGNAYANTLFNGFFQDTITITSSTLPSGTPVNLLLTASITYSTVCSGSSGNTFGADGTSSVAINFQQIINIIPPQGEGACQLAPFAPPGTPFFPGGGIFAHAQKSVFPTTVGASFTVIGTLSLNALSVDGGTVASDPPTMSLFIDSMTPGASYTTASGFTYFTPSLTFSSFQAKVEFEGAPPHSFETNGSFVLGSGSNGINPMNQAVTLQVGNYSVTIPPGSFSNSSGEFLYEGTIVGVRLELKIAPTGTNSFRFSAEGGGLTFIGMVNPVTVSLAIGDQVGQTTVKAEFE